MKKIEKVILEHGNIEMLCCYMESHFADLSDEMKETLHFYKNRFINTLGKSSAEVEAIYDLSLEEFFSNYRNTEDVVYRRYYEKHSIRALNILKRHDYVTLRDVLKIPRSELQKINGFSLHSNAFRCFKNTMENAGLDPDMVIK